MLTLKNGTEHQWCPRSFTRPFFLPYRTLYSHTGTGCRKLRQLEKPAKKGLEALNILLNKNPAQHLQRLPGLQVIRVLVQEREKLTLRKYIVNFKLFSIPYIISVQHIINPSSLVISGEYEPFINTNLSRSIRHKRGALQVWQSVDSDLPSYAYLIFDKQTKNRIMSHVWYQIETNSTSKYCLIALLQPYPAP